MSIDFSKAPEDATHYRVTSGVVLWLKVRGDYVWYYDGEFGWRRPTYTVTGEPIPTSAPNDAPNDLPSRGNRPNGSDPVDGPAHYNGTVCLEAIKASMTAEAFKGYLKGNVQKYLWRFEKKVNPVEDLKKAQWYLARLVAEQIDDEGEEEETE